MDIEKVKNQFDVIAKQYDSHRRCFIPCYDDYYVRSISLLKEYKDKAKNIADLGAGTGLLTKEMFLLYPEARFTLIDLSADMLEIAKTRFAGLDNFEYLEDDYISHLPNDYDIICSALSIHHLENDDKPNVYANICKSLSDGGIFVTLDQFCASSPIINDMYNTWWMNYIDKSGITSEQKAAWLERKKIDKEVSIEATVSMLREAGFISVECVYQFMKFATIIAIK